MTRNTVPESPGLDRRTFLSRTAATAIVITGFCNARDQSGCQHRTDPGNVMKALARFVGTVPGHNRVGACQKSFTACNVMPK
jgi:hypothetical protein